MNGCDCYYSNKCFAVYVVKFMLSKPTLVFWFQWLTSAPSFSVCSAYHQQGKGRSFKGTLPANTREIKEEDSEGGGRGGASQSWQQRWYPGGRATDPGWVCSAVQGSICILSHAHSLCGQQQVRQSYYHKHEGLKSAHSSTTDHVSVCLIICIISNFIVFPYWNEST